MDASKSDTNLLFRVFDMNVSKLFAVATCITMFAGSFVAHAQNDAQSTDPLEYIQPKLIAESLDWQAHYPENEKSLGRAGRVKLRFMVDNEGIPFEIIVLDSTSTMFEKAAKDGLGEARFEPATWKGEPIESVMTSIAIFQLPSGGPDISRKAVSTLSQFISEINKDEPDAGRLEKLISTMTDSRHNSNSYASTISTSRLQYAMKFGDRNEQIDAYRESLLFEQKQDIYFAAELVGLLVEEGNYGEALTAYEYYLANLEPEKPWKTLLAVQDPIKQIKDIKSSEKAFARTIKLSGKGYIEIPLLKSTFTLDNVIGAINSFKFRCERRFAKMEYVADTDFQIPASWGHCNLQVSGDKGTIARLIQL